MKIGKKLEIGMNAMNVLKGRKGPTNVKTLSVEINTTVHFLEQVMRDLRIAGLVDVKRGPGGGYQVSKFDTTAFHVAEAVGKEFTDSSEDSPTGRLQKSIKEAYLATRI